MASPLFQGLTRPAALAGLPMSQVLLLGLAVMAGFVATSSFAWLCGASALGYGALRWLAARDPHLVDILIARARFVPPPPAARRGRGYRHDG